MIAQLAVFLQRPTGDPLQFGWQIGIQTHGVDRSTVQDRLEDRGSALPTKGQRARRHFVKHRAEGEQIATRIQFSRSRLLRRHISDRAHRRTGSGQVGISGSSSRRLRGSCYRRAHFRQTEVQNLRVPAALSHENVGGLDIAMDDSLTVCRVQRIRDL